MLFKLKKPDVGYELDSNRLFDFLTVFTTNVNSHGLTDHIVGYEKEYHASWTALGDHFNITRRRADDVEKRPKSEWNMDDEITTLFAPTWQLVGGYIHGRIGERDANVPKWARKHPALNEETYTKQYKSLVRGRLRENNGERLYAVRGWLRGNAVITLSCECKPNEFCHRRIVADEMLRGLSVQIGLPYNYAGEIATVYGKKKSQLTMF